MKNLQNMTIEEREEYMKTENYRLYVIIKRYGGVREVCRNTNLTYARLTAYIKMKNKTLGSDAIATFLRKYPDFPVNWWLTGDISEGYPSDTLASKINELSPGILPVLKQLQLGVNSIIERLDKEITEE